MTLGQLLEALQAPNCAAIEAQPATRIPVTTLVNELGLSVRLTNCLKSMDCHTLRDILCKRSIEFKRCRNIGPKSFRELANLLEKHGYKFGELYGR